MIIVHVDNSSL